MIYTLNYDMDLFDEAENQNRPFIFASESNLKEIEVKGVKKGFFSNVIYGEKINFTWPKISFFYDSGEGKIKNDFLNNVVDWPVFHKRVVEEIIKEGIIGVSFFPVELIDKRTGTVNNEYSLMYIEKFIEAFDLNKSQYVFNEKYNYYTFIPMKTFFDEQACSGYDIFREKRSVSEIFVSDKIKNLIEKNNFTGFSFRQISFSDTSDKVANSNIMQKLLSLFDRKG